MLGQADNTVEQVASVLHLSLGGTVITDSIYGL